jgi:FG-GAP repeat
MSGDYAIVGRGESSVFHPGAAYIFHKTGSAWTQQAKLTNADAKSFDAFGSCVSIDGDYAVVGASGASPQGKVYIFHRNGATWSEVAQVAPGIGDEATSFFGGPVSLSGDTLMVGAWGEVYVFRNSSAGWTKEAKLTDAATTQTFFGASMRIDGDYVIVGAPNATLDGIRSGAAYIFLRNGTNWTQQAVLSASDGAEGDSFGLSASLRGSYAIVGAPDATSGGVTETGVAYIFERSGGSWMQVSKVEPVGPHKAKSFGWAVSITTTVFGDYAVVTDPSDFDGGAISGAAYLFKRVGPGAWSMVEPKITATDSGVSAEFGDSVYIGGDAILIGAPHHTDTVYAQGVAYVYTGFLELDTAFDVDKWKIYAVILFGLTAGGGGVIVLPGGGGGPVDPEPFRAWISMSPAKRDVYLALMIRDIASLIDDKEAKTEVQKAATSLRKRAAAKLPELKAIRFTNQGVS